MKSWINVYFSNTDAYFHGAPWSSRAAAMVAAESAPLRLLYRLVITPKAR